MASRLGYAYALSGRTVEAVTLLEQAIAGAPSRRAEVANREYLAWLGESYLMASRQDEAMDLARQALELSRASNERGHQARALRLLSEITARCEPPELAQAGDYYQEALELAQELGMRPLQTHCYLGLGALYSQIERLEDARAALSTAIHMYRTMEMSFWLPQAEAALGQVSG